MFTLVISCLTTFNLPWFMDLTFQVPMPLLLFTASNFSFITSYIHHLVLVLLWLHLFILLVLFLHWSPVAYWAPTDLGSSSFSVLSFSLFILFMGFSRKLLKWFAIRFSSGPRFVRTLHHPCLSWVTLHSMAHSFIELDKAVIHVISLVSFLWLWFSFCLQSFQGKNSEVVCHSLLQWTTFCHNSPLWSIHLGWPYLAWLIVSLH